MSQINSGILTSERFTSIAPRFSQINTFAIQQLNQARSLNNVSILTHPLYEIQTLNWGKWRAIYESGDSFIEEYTVKFSQRETNEDFAARKRLTPTPAFAKAAVNEIKNAIFQRMGDVTRSEGPDSFLRASEGLDGGVNLRGAKMNWFIGHYVLPELLVMSKVGVYVDNFEMLPGESLATKGNKHPYFYVYRAEDIRSWTESTYGDETVFQSLLLRDYNYVVDPVTNLPIGEIEVFRFLWIAEDGYVHVQFYDQAGNFNGDEITLSITRIPFVIFEINDSLLKDVANHQIALLNLESSDVSFILKGNLPFYVEEYDPNNNSQFLRNAQDAYNSVISGPTNPDGTPVYVVDGDGITHSTVATGTEIRAAESRDELLVGATQGRRYPTGAKTPSFIAPPTGPIESSLKKQAGLKEDIRNLVQLAVSNTKSKGVSAESKAFDQQGLESGLSYIGLELEHGENCLGCLWAMYENAGDPVIHYPKEYYLETPEQTSKKIEVWLKIRSEIPSKTFKSEAGKEISRLMLGVKIPQDTLDKIYQEIQDAGFYTSNPKEIVADAQAGLVSVDTASQARGYPEGEADAAKQDHAERLQRVMEAQIGKAVEKSATKIDEASLGATTIPGEGTGAARGVPDLATDPSAGKNEKKGKKGRGPGK